MPSTTPKRLVNIVKKENRKRKIKTIVPDFNAAVQQIDDPRTRKGAIDYPLNEILFTALVAMICGSESYQDFATFGNAQLDWLKHFFPFKHGIPSHDTFRRVFELLHPKSLEKTYRLLISGLKVRPTKHIAIDGKTSRGCYHIKGQCLLHVVSAWDTNNGIALGQLSTQNDEGKEVGEYNTIPQVIEALDMKKAVVTIDAGGCYDNIVKAIIEGKGNYVITLKDNQPTLIEEAKTAFSDAESNGSNEVKSIETSDHGHGRRERRTYQAISVPKGSDSRKKWQGLQTFVRVESYREVKGKESVEIRYLISNLSSNQIERIAQCARSHWGIENSLHWVLDVSFGEDGNRTRCGHGAENLSVLRRLAVGLMRRVKGKQTVPNMMFQAALSTTFRTNIVKQIVNEYDLMR
jgi:predicted transposase YbfD/YdcC